MVAPQDAWLFHLSLTPSSHVRLVALLSVLLAVAGLSAQATPVAVGGGLTASATTNDEGPVGIVPFVRGPNLSLSISGQHDSSNGWSSVFSPDLAWRFNRSFSADASVPIFDYINVVVTKGTKAKPLYTNANEHFVPGDTALNGHYDDSFRLFNFNATATLGLPSGNTDYGLGAGKVTYFLNHHFERDIGIFTPDIELGIGDSSALVDARIRKSYTSVGTLAHFQAGTSVSFPFQVSFEADAYEELPVAAETLYSTTGKGKKKVTTAMNSGVAEDNGFSTSLDLPVNPHMTLSGFYNRSLRNKIDTAGLSITFFARAAPRASER